MATDRDTNREFFFLASLASKRPRSPSLLNLGRPLPTLPFLARDRPISDRVPGGQQTPNRVGGQLAQKMIVREIALIFSTVFETNMRARGN